MYRIKKANLVLGEADALYIYAVNYNVLRIMSGMGGVDGDGNLVDISAEPLFIPLQFWFCRNPGLALPLIALQYHEVKIILNRRGDSDLTTSQNKLWADYIYLDTDERRRFAQVSHEYLIEQVQEQTLAAGGGDILGVGVLPHGG